jgi:dolichol-phosphate mannosyltransferase
MKKTQHTLTAIVPVHNEELFLEESLNRLLKIKIIDKIIVVDDCSSDNSIEIIKKIEKENERLLVFQTSVNLGKGGAIKLAFNEISTDYAIIHDADLEYDPEDIYKLYNKIEKNRSNFVIGTRFSDKSRPQIYKRTFYANKFLSFLFSLVYKEKVSDIATCYKLIPSNYLKNTAFAENGFAIEVELLAKFLLIDKNYSEVPITYVPRSYKEGKKIKFLDGIKYILVIFKYRFI